MQTFSLYPLINGCCGCGNPDCHSAGKHPAERWKQTAPDRPDLVPTPERGVGIATGARSGIFVVDLDVKNGIDGLAELLQLGDIPQTYTVATPSGGFHLYFRHPGFPVRNSASSIAPGVDVRGDGGYVVAPGSPHVSGGVYTIAADLPIADAPAWLLARPELRHVVIELADPAAEAEACLAHVPRDWRVAKAAAWLAQQQPAIEGEGGDVHTFRMLTRAVHDNGLTDAHMIADAFAEWNARCDPPWSGKEWAHKIDSVLHHATTPWSTTIGMAYALERHQPGDISKAMQKQMPTIEGGKVTAGKITFELGGYDADLPPLIYLVDGLFCRADVVMLVAHGGSLKTWTAMSLSLAIATGRPWLGKFVTMRGRVALIDFESGSYEVRRRLKLLGARDADVGDRLLRSSYSAAQLTDPETWIELASLKLDLIVIDSFAAASQGLDENDASADLLLQHAGRFAEVTGCAVIVIHHSRKGGGGDRREAVRGSTALFAACDRIFEFSDPESQDGGIERTTMHAIKNGAGRRPFDTRVELSDKGMRYVEIEAAPVEEKTPDKNRALVLNILKQHANGVPKKTLTDMMQGRRETKFEVLAELALSNITVEFNDQQSGKKALCVMLKPGAVL